MNRRTRSAFAVLFLMWGALWATATPENGTAGEPPARIVLAAPDVVDYSWGATPAP